MQVKQKIQELLKHLNRGVFEKEEIMALTLLSAVAGESVFFLGAPGVAKSLIARRLKYAFENGKAFEYLMSRFSTPDEIFGPIAISQLKDHDRYERVVENYLPSSTVVFLDEIWKAGPSIQNSLLTVLNEKIYRNGAQEIKDLPVKALISASNELPAKGENLEALWDRFLVRLVVEGIKKPENFNAMISEKLEFDEKAITDDLKISDVEYMDWDDKIDWIEIPENVFSVIDVIRKKLQVHNDKEGNEDNQIYISDRRWRKIVRLLRTSAFLNDRKSVDLMDCFLIKECIWNEEGQKETVKQFVSGAIRHYGYKLEFDFKSLKEALDELKKEIEVETRFEKNISVETIDEWDGYHILEDQPSTRVSHIKIEDFDKLTHVPQQIYLYRCDSYNSLRRDSYSSYSAKKGKDKYHVSINNMECKLQTTTEEDKRVITRKPHKAVKEAWDKKIEQFLTVTNQQRDELEKYRTKDLKNLRTNIFVSPAWAIFVEAHLSETQKEIEKYEVEIHKIQSDYENLEEKEVVIQ